MAFFDGPVGRVLNRFSKDMGITDETLPYIAQDVLQVGRQLLKSTNPELRFCPNY